MWRTSKGTTCLRSGESGACWHCILCGTHPLHKSTTQATTVILCKPSLNLNHHHPLYWACSGARILPLSPSLLTSATTSLGSHRHPSLPRWLFRLTSRLTLHDVQLVFEQQRKTPPLSSGAGGLFARPLSRLYFAPSARHGAPYWDPLWLAPPLNSSPPLRDPTNQHSSTSSPILLLRPGLCRRLVTTRIPLSYTRGFSRSHPLLITRA